METNLEKELIGFFEDKKLFKYKKDEIIYRPGEVFTHVAFIKSGYVRLYEVSQGGREITINLFNPIFVMSLMYALNGDENKYYFEAVTDVEIWRSPLPDFSEFLRNNKDVMFTVMQKTLHIVEILLDNVRSTISGDSNLKVISIIISLAQRFGQKQDKDLTIDFNTTHRLIASLAGTSRETASIQIKELERKGYITQKDNRIIINDLEKLKELAA